MEGDFIKTNEWLLPLSWLYGIGVELRNWCFDIGILKEKSYPMPIISVGNLTVGGCGKTPHVEYLTRLLTRRNKIAVLSRGYKRKSKGYILANENTTMPEIGDEPYQMKSKFPEIYMAVDKNRCHGIERLRKDEATKDVDVIILDDAYQHRYVKPGLNILLIDYHRLIVYDKLLPAGRLREPLSAKERADVVIVTKCPEDLKPMEYRVLTKALNLRPYQKLYFSGIEYQDMHHLHNDFSRPVSSIMPDENILLISGIASPEQITHDLGKYSNRITQLTFPDHHQFNSDDLAKIMDAFNALPHPKIIITTEKDATRMTHLENLPMEIKESLFTLPISISIKQDKEEEFNERILSFVQKNSKNSVLNKL